MRLVSFRLCVLSLSCFILLQADVSVGLSANQLYKQVSQSIYTVYGYNQDSNQRVALASGIAVSKQVLVTNCHVAKIGNEYQVRLKNKYYAASLVQYNYKQDLCYLKVKDVEFKPVELRKSDQVVIGEDVFAIGNPHGLEKSISKGIISNKHKVAGGMMLQTDATISFGSSGGGLFNKDGELIGVTRVGHRFKNIAFAVPSDWIAAYLMQVNKPAYC